mgnify:CR=1 FL=1
MKLYSTNSPEEFVSLREAVLRGLPQDNGLYMPETIPQLSADFFEKLTKYSFQELSYQVVSTLLQGALPEEVLKNIIESAIDFPAPVVQLDDDTYVLELFHGNTLAFKDFGARFMSRLMSYFVKDDDRELVILVATSGDTGSAVANGFHGVENIKVIVLYPQGRVSDLQERQMTTLGKNITALQVDGSFDDCQRLVKQAFLDQELTQAHQLTSANSINISRLIPQMLYYFEAYKQLLEKEVDTEKIVFTVPSGNFGNITAGLLAQKMGLPIKKFVAATNDNDVFHQYLKTGEYNPSVSVQTLSNAMDVGAPSNFARIKDLCFTWSEIKDLIESYTVNDEDTITKMQAVYKKHEYTACPHTAVGLESWERHQAENPEAKSVILSTAHPMKFGDVIEKALGATSELPEKLAVLTKREKSFTQMSAQFKDFKKYLLDMNN